MTSGEKKTGVIFKSALKYSPGIKVSDFSTFNLNKVMDMILKCQVLTLMCVDEHQYRKNCVRDTALLKLSVQCLGLYKELDTWLRV